MAIWTDAVAWIGLPLVLFLTAAGIGLVIERAAGVELSGALLAPLGVCGSILIAMAVAYVGLDSVFTVVLLVAATVAGFALHRCDLGGAARRLTGGWAGLAGLLVLGLYMAPTVLTGHWTWSGYNFVNDTAFQFLLTDWIRDNGIPYHAQPRSTTSETVRVYLENTYPLGAPAHLAALTTMLGTTVDVIYQTYIASLAALMGMALAALARRVVPNAIWAAAAGFLAASASLTYHYALQGNIKEIAMLLAIVTAAAVGREVLAAERPTRAVLALAVPLAAAASVYYAAAVPYIAALAAGLLVIGFLTPGPAGRAVLPVAFIAGTAAVAVLSLPAVLKVARSLLILDEAFASGDTGASAPLTLGHLARPLLPSQVGGIWLDGDYRLPVVGAFAHTLTDAGLVVVFALCVAGVVASAVRRELGPVALLAALAVVYLAVAPRTSPYADAKMMAILSPAVVLCGVVGAAWLWQRLRAPGVAVATAVGLLILASAAFAYHDTRLAPSDRIADLEDLGERYAGSPDLMLFSEYEEFAKYYLRHSVINTPTEAMTESFIQLRAGGDFLAHTFDLDEMTLDYVQRFPVIVNRRKPTQSRPPANYRFEYRNNSYEVWRREREPRVLDHLPVQGTDKAAAYPPCSVVRTFAESAPRGTELVAAVGPETVTYDFERHHGVPAGWEHDPISPGERVLATPGSARTNMTVAGGVYRVWLEGTFGRRMEVSVDGRAVGAASGVNTPRGWLPAGTVRLTPGLHTVEVRRPPGNLKPGDGARSSLGAVALVGPGEPELVRVPPSRASQLCGRELDWIEVVAGREASADER